MPKWEYKNLGIKKDAADENIIIRFMECLGAEVISNTQNMSEPIQPYVISDFLWFGLQGTDLRCDTSVSDKNEYGESDITNLYELLCAVFGKFIMYYQYDEGTTVVDMYEGIDEVYNWVDNKKIIINITAHSYCLGDNWAFGRNVKAGTEREKGYKRFVKKLRPILCIGALCDKIRSNAAEKGYTDIVELANNAEIADITTIQGLFWFKGRHIFIPESYKKKIDPRDIGSNENLQSITVADGNKKYCIESGALYSKDKKTLISCLEREGSEFVIPDGVEVIAENAFYNRKNITSIIIPDSIKTFTSDSFKGTAWFDYCSDEFRIISGVLIKYKGGIDDVIIPDGVTEIFDNVFSSKKLKSVVMPKSLKTIGNRAFANCTELTSVTFSDGLTYIGTAAFQCCKKLETLVMPESLKSIGDYAFEKCTELTSVTVPDGLTYIGTSAFSGCQKLEAFVIPSGVTDLSSAFINCSNLKSITIPDSVENISFAAFWGSDNLREVHLGENSNFVISDGCLYTKDMEVKLAKLAE